MPGEPVVCRTCDIDDFPVTLMNTPIPCARKVLIVEDDTHIATCLAVRLRAAAYEVILAGDVKGGIDAILRDKPNLVILDICLPGGGGFCVAEWIRECLSPRVPVIFMTASKQPGLSQRATALGAVGFFEKPYDAPTLLATIQRTLAGRQMQ
jgi:DNA-binding response OmpR family regulator